MIKKDLNPTWNEFFAFYIDHSDPVRLEKMSLSVMCFDHDYVTPDDPLGFIELPLSKIPRGKVHDSNGPFRLSERPAASCADNRAVFQAGRCGARRGAHVPTTSITHFERNPQDITGLHDNQLKDSVISAVRRRTLFLVANH